MGTVYAELSMSIDGYIAGPHVSEELPLGERGELLHEWMWRDRTAAESTAFEEDYFRNVGALIMGRRMVDLGIGPWGENPTFHAPCFVVTHRPNDSIIKQGGTSYIFVTEGIPAALAQARAAAGQQDIRVNGGADITQQFLRAGLLDQLRLHVIPVVLGSGTPLFDEAAAGMNWTVADASADRQVIHMALGNSEPRLGNEAHHGRA